jgi:hypothetical protein
VDISWSVERFKSLRWRSNNAFDTEVAEVLPLGDLGVPYALSNESRPDDQDPVAIESIDKPRDNGEGSRRFARANISPRSSGITFEEEVDESMLILRNKRERL